MIGRQHTALFGGACCRKQFSLADTWCKDYDFSSKPGLGTLDTEFYSTVQLSASLASKDGSHHLDIATQFPTCTKQIPHLTFYQDPMGYYLNLSS